MADLIELTNFIVSLSENPEQARRFREDPNAVIEESGLSEETRNLLRSEPQEFMTEVFARAKPTKPIVQTNVQTNIHVSTNTNTNVNTQLTTNTWVIVF